MIKSIHHAAISSGMVFYRPPQSMGPNTLVTYGRDPDGNVIELMETRDN